MRTLADLIGYALERAPHDPDKAEDLLQFFCDAVEANKSPDEAILKYFAGCFRLILAGKIGPASALNLHGSKGKRRKRTLEQIDERDFDLARAVFRRMEAGMKRNDAIEDVAVAEKVSATVAKRAYEACGAQVRAYEASLKDTD